MNVFEKFLHVWQLIIAALTTPEGQALLDYLEFLVKDVMDGPDTSPPPPATADEIRAKRGVRVMGGK